MTPLRCPPRRGYPLGHIVDSDEFEEMPRHEPAWQVRDRIAAYRKDLVAAGYSPVPVNGKAPALEEWQKTSASNNLIDHWIDQYPDALSTGVLTRNTPAIDIDVTDEEIAEELTALAEEILGKSPIRIGRAPKRAMLYRTDAPFPKLTRAFTSPTGEAHRVEVLADGAERYLSVTDRRVSRGGWDARAFAALPEEIRLRLLRRALDRHGHEGPAELGKIETLLGAMDRAMADGKTRLKQTLAGAAISLSEGRILVQPAPPRRRRTA